MTNVLVTGSGGYLGGRLVRHLAADAATTVVGLVRDPVAWLDVEQVRFDLTAPASDLAPLLDDVHTVVHLAGANEVSAVDDPDGALRDTLAATRHVSEAAAAAGVQRIVYVSTVHVYGAALREHAVISEETVPQPRAIYAIARLASEHLLAMADGPELVVFRLTNSVGAPADPSVRRWTLVANDLCQQAATTGALHLRTHGMQWRDFVAIGDVCEALRLAVDGAVGAGTYNLGLGRCITVRDLAGLVQDAVEAQTGARPPLTTPDPPSTSPGPYRVDVSKLATRGWRPRHDVGDAVAETVRACLAWSREEARS